MDTIVPPPVPVGTPPTTTAALFRAARALLGLTPGRIAAEAGVDVRVVRRLEREGTDLPDGTIRAVLAAFHRLGIGFLPTGLYRLPPVDLPHAPIPAPMTAEERHAATMAIGRHCAALPDLDPGFNQDSLYDEHGLPA